MKIPATEKPEASQEVKRNSIDRQQREDRLAAALRANLRRRKSGMNQADPLPQHPEPGRPHG